MSQIPLRSAPAMRIGAFVGLSIAEMLVTSYLFVLDVGRSSSWFDPATTVRKLVLLAIAATVVFALLTWNRRAALASNWIAATDKSDWRDAVLTNLVLFAGLCLATVAFSAYAATSNHAPWSLYAVYCIPLVATAVSLLAVAAPTRYWLDFVAEFARLEIPLALAAGLAVTSAASYTAGIWSELAGATLYVSYHLVALFDPAVRIDYATRMLAVAAFEVRIDEACSGYEGIGLVTAFLTIYFAVFRKSLRFPNALLLLPIGVAAIWLLNSVRIATLVVIGGYVSPDIAISGFHSQAGWIAFVLVSVAIMVMAPRLAFFGTPQAQPVDKAIRTDDREMLAFIGPFMALMAASIVISASAPYDTSLYGLKVLAVAFCLYVFRDLYSPLLARIDPLAIATGIAVGIVWLLTASAPAHDNALGTFLAEQPEAVAIAWLMLRTIGAIVMIPIAEELAFRGLLYRWIISRKFETVSYGTLAWTPLVVSSLLFGLMHERWLAGALAGGVFALLMVRKGRLSDAVAAHMAANAVIMVWSITTQDWSHL